MIDLQGLFSEKAHFLRFCFVCAAGVTGYSPHVWQQLVVLLEFPPHQLYRSEFPGGGVQTWSVPRHTSLQPNIKK